VTDDPEQAPELTPEQEAEVSRLLAEAAGPVPTPARVADRLDEALAGLVEQRARPPRDLVAPRSRRRWPQALLAAAAVVVAGYGVGAAVTGGTGSDGAASDSTTDSGSGSAAGAGSTPGDRPNADSVRPGAGTETSAPGRVVPLHADRLESEIERVLARPRRPLRAYTAMPPEAADRCGPPRLGRGATWYLARLDGRPATLVTEPARHGRFRASVWGCAGGLLARTSVPAP
jgi:hypothetical protein